MARTLKAVSNVIPSEITISLADKDLQDYLVKISPGDIKSEILGLIKIGLMCVTRANTNNEIDFWEKKSQELQMNLLRKTEEVINKDFLQAIKKQLGVKDGQLLAPIANQVETTSRFIDKALTSNETRIKAVVSEFNSSLTDGTLVESFGKILIKELSPLIAELRSINYHVIEQKGEENIKGSTTLKGKEYEQHILEQVQTWARYNKFKVENVGMDNRPGDIVVESLSEKIKIAIEVKDISTPKGHSVLTREMGQVIQERKATTAIFLCKTINGLAKEIGSYGEGVSDNIKWVATTGESLEVALNHCLVQERLRLANEKNLSITNAKKIKENIELAKTLMRDMSQHYRSITEIQKAATTLESSLRNTNAEVLRALSAANDLITCK
jgi:hypothetical protein